MSVSTNPPSHGDHAFAAAPPPRGMGAKVAIGVLVLFGAALLLGLIPRLKLKPELARAAQEEKTAAPLVTVVRPAAAPRTVHLELPGNIEGLEQTAISARAGGYVREWTADIGDKVKAGQTLALISAPDADQETAQAYAQVAQSQAGVQQSRAAVAQMQANAAQASANVSKAQAGLESARTELAHAKAALAGAQHQAAQQRANLTQGQANLELAKTTADRYAYLVTQGAVAQQTADQMTAAYKTNLANVESLQAAVKASDAAVAEAQESVHSAEANIKAAADDIRAAKAAHTAAQANVQAAQANVDASSANLQANNANYKRNTVLQGYQRVTAPFDGIVTARNIDVGSLITSTGNPAVADSGASSSSTISGASTNGGLFSMVRTDRMRTFVSLPQQFVNSVQVGQTAQVFVKELGDKPFTGRIVRNTVVLDPATRTLATEIQLDNTTRKLRPGLFATVSLDLPQATRAWRIPDSALISDGSGNRVAIVLPDGKLHFQPVEVGTDYGKEMDIVSGLNGGETLVSNPNPSLTEGLAVQTTEAPVIKKPGQGGGRGAAPAGGGQKKE